MKAPEPPTGKDVLKYLIIIIVIVASLIFIRG